MGALNPMNVVFEAAAAGHGPCNFRGTLIGCSMAIASNQLLFRVCN
jgi:hypothetical protein